ncbi:hypothetical protein OHA43_02180 [Streptomyces sp. NBC_00305]|uniref:hypothetical protein n=1 Tax=Streptomyces sp. NBC_00264 TaxID=2975693 RepID=UPI0022560DE0|nr:hypothetical protein [Streptomyces sp. NBC_00264]MCX5158144.1 hypothetical protein [Streptomyces sp. NBC_00305]
MKREDEDMTAAATASDPRATDPSPMGALSRLIQDAKDQGLSYQEMADRAIDSETGTRLVKQAIQKLVKTPPVNPPPVAQLRALANATGVSLRRLKEAAAEQWLEYEATELAGYDDDVRIILGHLGGMSKQEQRRWRAMIEADERAKREAP